MSEWQVGRLDSFFTLKRGYDLPKQSRVSGSVPIIASSGFADFHNEAKVNESGVVTGRYGTIGSVFFSDVPFWPLNTSLYVNDFKGNDKKFIYYFLQTLDWEKFSDKLKQVLELPDLRKKILFTLGMFLIARIGTHIPVPGIDTESITRAMENNDLLKFFNTFSGGAFSRVSIFALGVMPYINASIIMQLMGVLVPKLEELQKEGESGRQKITQWTRYLTIVIAIIQGLATVTWLEQARLAQVDIFFRIYTITVLTAGSVFSGMEDALPAQSGTCRFLICEPLYGNLQS